MGLAASQARLLLLTSRRSDLEYRAQMISQHKIALAMQTEQIATDYTVALNDKCMKFTYRVNENGVRETEDLTYTSVVLGSQFDKYRLVDREGNVVYLTEADIEGKVNAGEKTKQYPLLNDKEWFQEALRVGLIQIEEQVQIGNKYNYQMVDDQGNVTTKTEAEYQALLNGTDAQKAEAAKYKKVNGDPIYAWEGQLISGMSEITDELNTKNDNIAMATYERKSQEIQSKDKQLDVELKQVETQLEACKSEQESVKKLIQDHAQNDFKSFA